MNLYSYYLTILLTHYFLCYLICRYIVAANIMVPFLVLILMGGAHFIIDLIAYLYPAYASIRAIETDEDKDDDTLWLTYWLVFSLFKMFEGLCDTLLQYIPLYLVLKCTFLVWCFHPSFKGATVCYSHVLRPYFMPFLGIIDDTKQKKDQ